MVTPDSQATILDGVRRPGIEASVINDLQLQLEALEDRVQRVFSRGSRRRRRDGGGCYERQFFQDLYFKFGWGCAWAIFV